VGEETKVKTVSGSFYKNSSVAERPAGETPCWCDLKELKTKQRVEGSECPRKSRRL
jgi:hypothetical protein